MLFLNYLFWHYAVAPIEIVKLLKNYMVATWRKFLIWGHLRTLFYPWHRITVSDVMKPKNIMDKVTNAMAEAYIRLVAAIIRLTVVLFGLVVEGIIVTVFIAVFAVWFMWPVLVFISIGKGFSIIF